MIYKKKEERKICKNIIMTTQCLSNLRKTEDGLTLDLITHYPIMEKGIAVAKKVLQAVEFFKGEAGEVSWDDVLLRTIRASQTKHMGTLYSALVSQSPIPPNIGN